MMRIDLENIADTAYISKVVKAKKEKKQKKKKENKQKRRERRLPGKVKAAEKGSVGGERVSHLRAK